ncbi:MAG: sigma-70 family RNA polymerase sigma factor [Dyella sp.]
MIQIRQRRKRQFEALLSQHRGIVLKVASAYASAGEDRRDLAQEIAIQLWRAFPAYDPARSFSTWMYRIALNVGISQLRRDQARRRRFEPLMDDHLAHFQTVDVADEPDRRLAQLESFIAALDELNRALIVLYLEERSYAQIAEILGLSETNVATKLSRIKQQLRGRLVALDSERR